jgi:transcriptional regulator with XRE-family HTH domain
MNDFARKLRQLRIENRLTQEQLQIELKSQGHKVSNKSTISRWEKGLRKPEIEVVEDLEDILGVSRGVLLRAARYTVDISSDQLVSPQIDYDMIVQRREHFAELASVAKSLLVNGLDNVSCPGWSTNRSLLGKYHIPNEHTVSGHDVITKEQLSEKLNQNMAAILKEKDWFFRHHFVPYVKSKLSDELKTELFDKIIEEQPFQLIEVLRRLAYGEIL